MAKYGTKVTRTASAGLDVGSVITAASSPRRFKLYEIVVGSDATPADNAYLFEVYKRTGAATAGTAPTISPLDVSDAIASTVVANQAPTTNGAGGNTAIASWPLNQRATFRWVAAPGAEFIAPATASNGFGLGTLTGPAVTTTATLFWDEL